MKPRVSPFFWVVALFAALCLPLILAKGRGYSWDETRYYIPAILQIREHWPRLDLRADSLSATAPGYPYLLASASFLIGSGRLNLRLANWGVSLAILWIVWRQLPFSRRSLALVALLPLAASNFFVKSASWVVTDNAALLGMALVLAGALGGKESFPAWAQGIVAAVTVMVRQTYVWLAVPVGLQCLRGSRRALFGAASSLLALGVLVLLALSWGGLVPPEWTAAAQVHGSGWVAGFASFAYILSVFAAVGVVYYFAASGMKRWRQDFLNVVSCLAALFGLFAALIGPTDFSYSDGRWGGYFWPLIASLPAPGHRSLFFLAAAPLGGALLGAMFTHLKRARGFTRAFIWISSYCAWAATFFPNRELFHRYYEPATLLFVIYWLGMAANEEELEGPQAAALGALAAVQLAITLVFAFGRTFAAA
jgi:hypothetical protein